jgi:hypothetical protein
VTHDEANAMARRLVRFLESGKADEALFSSDVFCDFTSPRWRQQAVGVAPVLELRRLGHPSPGKVPRYRCDPIPTGFVLELEEAWQDGGESWYCREMFRADVQGNSIAALSVYCTGDWDSQRRAQHCREVQLLRP